MSDTVDKILDQAEREMRLNGFHAVSFRDLASALGIKSASVHYHFPRKEDLGLSLVERYSKNFFAALGAETAEAGNPQEFLNGLVKVYGKALLVEGRICLCGLLGAESAGLPASVSDAVASFHQENINWLAGKLDQGLSQSDRQSVAARIVSTLQGAMMMANSIGDPALFDRITKNLSPR